MESSDRTRRRDLLGMRDHADALTPGEAAAVAGIVAQVAPTDALVVGVPLAPAPELLAACKRVAGAGSGDLDALSAGEPVDLVYVAQSVAIGDLTPVMQTLLGGSRAQSAVWIVEGAAVTERRAALDALEFGAWGAVQQVDLDFVGGHLRVDQDHRYETAGGLAVVVTDAEAPPRSTRPDPADRYPTAHVLRRGRDLLAATDADLQYPPIPELLRETHHQALQAALDADELYAAATLRDLRRDHERLLATYLSVVNSFSWRLTSPLRRARRPRRGA